MKATSARPPHPDPAGNAAAGRRRAAPAGAMSARGVGAVRRRPASATAGPACSRCEQPLEAAELLGIGRERQRRVDLARLARLRGRVGELGVVRQDLGVAGSAPSRSAAWRRRPPASSSRPWDSRPALDRGLHVVDRRQGQGGGRPQGGGTGGHQHHLAFHLHVLSDGEPPTSCSLGVGVVSRATWGRPGRGSRGRRPAFRSVASHRSSASRKPTGRPRIADTHFYLARGGRQPVTGTRWPHARTAALILQIQSQRTHHGQQTHHPGQRTTARWKAPARSAPPAPTNASK